jgi:hypothetical protein
MFQPSAQRCKGGPLVQVAAGASASAQAEFVAICCSVSARPMPNEVVPFVHGGWHGYVKESHHHFV